MWLTQIRASVLAVALMAAAVVSGQAQTVISNVLTLNQERLFSQSLYGKRVLKELEAASVELAAENQRIQAELEAEELSLTEQRPTLEPALFRELAEAFDAKVQDLRRVQRQKTADLNRETDAERKRFFELVVPILLRLMQETGGSVIVDQRAIVLASNSIDITSVAIERVNAEVGDGATQEPQE